MIDEATKLFGALSGWAREHAETVGEDLAGLGEHASSAAAEVDEHLSTGAPECIYCPMCRTVHAVRQLSPEVRTHLTVAVTSLAQAATALLSTTPPDPAAGRRPTVVERIGLDDDWPEDE